MANIGKKIWRGVKGFFGGGGSSEKKLAQEASSDATEVVENEALNQTKKQSRKEIKDAKRRKRKEDKEKRKQEPSKNMKNRAKKENSEAEQSTISNDPQEETAELTDYQKKTQEIVGNLNKKSGGKYTFEDVTRGKSISEMHGWDKNAYQEKANRLNTQKENLFNEIQGAKDEEEMIGILRGNGIEAREGMSHELIEARINAKLENDLKEDASFGDYFFGNHGVGATALGVAGVSVLALSDSRGRVSNSRLYSNPF